MINKLFKWNVYIIVLFIHLVSGQSNTVGVIVNAPNAFNGYSLFTPRASNYTFLIDNNGYLVHMWESDYHPSMLAYLLEDGTLLRATKLVDENGETGGFQVLSWDSEILFEYINGNQHHDIEPLPNGNVLVLLDYHLTKTEAIDNGADPSQITNKLTLLHLIEIDYKNSDSVKIVWEWNSKDHLVQDFDSTKHNYGVVSEHPELININYALRNNPDWLHPNSVSYNQDLDQIMVSIRHFNELWIIDHSTTTNEAASHLGGLQNMGGDLIYRWGNPASYDRGESTSQQLFGQHDAQWIKKGYLGEGNILVFNNGISRPEGAYSSVDELTPPVDSSGRYLIEPGEDYGPSDLYWAFPSELTEQLYSPLFSGAQRLPNGNTLICYGTSGTFYEVTNDGDLVWKYINPVGMYGMINQGYPTIQNGVGRCFKYEPEYKGFSGRNLEPKMLLENAVLSTDINVVPEIFEISSAFPNPFNSQVNINYILHQKLDLEFHIRDINGREIKAVKKDRQNAGTYTIMWDAKGVSSGIYFFTVKVNDKIYSKKIIYLK